MASRCRRSVSLRTLVTSCSSIAMAGSGGKPPVRLVGPAVWPEPTKTWYWKSFCRSVNRTGRRRVRRYQGRDRRRGVAFVVNQLRERAGFGGVLVSPAVIKAMLEASSEEVLSRGWDSLGRGIQPLLIELYKALIGVVRRMAEVLGPEDVFELEHGMALADLGQRVGFRQALQTAAKLEAGLSKHKPKPQSNARESHADTDTRRGHLPCRRIRIDFDPRFDQRLLHSQLASWSRRRLAPDLFDIKFLRDELSITAGMRTNSCVGAGLWFSSSVRSGQARFKDVELPWQRCVSSCFSASGGCHRS